MKILYLCDKLISFILNEIVELKVNNDVTMLAYYSERIFDSITKPMLMKYGLEENYFRYRSSLFPDKGNRYMQFMKMMIYDCMCHPVRTIKVINFILRNCNRPRYGFINYFEVRDILDQHFDIIHLPFSTPDALDKVQIISYALNVPFTLCFRAHDIFYRNNFSEILKRIDIIKKASQIITIADFNRKYINERIQVDQNIEIIHSAINVDFFKPEDVKRSHHSIITICRLSEEKGIVYLLDACHLLNERNIEYACTIIGEGPEREHYEKRIQERKIPNINMINYLSQDDIKKHLNHASVFVLPSIIGSSGLGDIMANSVKEAMAMEVPVITTDIRANSELIDNGISGILVPPRDHVAIADAIEKLFDNPDLAFRIGKEGRRKIERDFNVKIEAGKLEGIFKKALNKEYLDTYKETEYEIKRAYVNSKR